MLTILNWLQITGISRIMPNKVVDFLFFVDISDQIVDLAIVFLGQLEMDHNTFYTFVRNG
jgi:hypothetical protein